VAKAPPTAPAIAWAAGGRAADELEFDGMIIYLQERSLYNMSRDVCPSGLI
jgi:hypothetical protein